MQLNAFLRVKKKTRKIIKLSYYPFKVGKGANRFVHNSLFFVQNWKSIALHMKDDAEIMKMKEETKSDGQFFKA